MGDFVSPGLMVAGGIGQGLSQGVDAFLKTRQMNQQNQQSKTALGLMAAKEGMDINPDTGLIAPNAMGQARQAAQTGAYQNESAQSAQSLRELNQSNDPDSDYSKNIQPLGKAYMGYLKQTQAYKKNPTDFSGIEEAFNNGSAHQINQIAGHPLLKDLVTGVAGQDRLNELLTAMAMKTSGNADKVDTKAESGFKDSLQKIKPYTEADASAQSADAVIDTVNNATKNKTSAASLPTELANFVSKGKRLHTSTIDAFTNPNSDIMTRIQQGIAKSATGTIPPAVAADIVQYLGNEKQSAVNQKQAVMKSEAENFKLIHGRYPKIYDPNAQPQGLMSQSQQPASQFNEGQTASDAKGNQMIFKGGQWVPVQ